MYRYLFIPEGKIVTTSRSLENLTSLSCQLESVLVLFKEDLHNTAYRTTLLLSVNKQFAEYNKEYLHFVSLDELEYIDERP